MTHDDLVVQRPEGLFCPAGDFFIDPMRRVDRAVITHAHADHARAGHRRYLCAAPGVGVLRARLGRGIDVQGLPYGEPLAIGDVRISLHPAGHILGSAQVRIEHRGHGHGRGHGHAHGRGHGHAHGHAHGPVWVVAGDYFHSHRAGEPGAVANPTCPPFEPVRCDLFVTEATFGSPVYRWPSHARVFDDLVDWWRGNAEEGALSVVQAYSLGKTQHVLAMLHALGADVGPVLAHPAADAINAAHREEGVALPPLADWSRVEDPLALRGALVVGPSQATAPWRWHRGLEVREAFASGWMQVRGARRRGGLDRGFVLSDHADWPGLLAAIEATGCAEVVVMHGDEALLARACAERGIATRRLRVVL